jgi:cytochrome bd-type quinol oxidase subunit 2
MEAQVSQNLETERKGERFTLIDPPITPEDPISPNRPLVLALGLILSVGAAFLTVAVKEALDTSVRSIRDLEALVQVAPLVTIPVIVTAEDEARRRRAVRRTWAGAIASVAVAVLCIHIFYRPLDLLWFAALRRVGL